MLSVLEGELSMTASDNGEKEEVCADLRFETGCWRNARNACWGRRIDGCRQVLWNQKEESSNNKAGTGRQRGRLKQAGRQVQQVEAQIDTCR